MRSARRCVLRPPRAHRELVVSYGLQSVRASQRQWAVSRAHAWLRYSVRAWQLGLGPAVRQRQHVGRHHRGRHFDQGVGRGALFPAVFWALWGFQRLYNVSACHLVLQRVVPVASHRVTTHTQVTITMTGPATVWFAVGFNAPNQKMMDQVSSPPMPPTSAPGLGAHRCHICTGTGADLCPHICTGTWLTPPTHICTGTGHQRERFAW